MSIPANLKTPGAYTDVNINTQRTGLLANTHKVLFITADSISPDMPKNIYDKAAADADFGQGSIAGRMITAAIKTNRFVDVQCLGKPLTHISCDGATQTASIRNSYDSSFDGISKLWTVSLNDELFLNNETFSDLSRIFNAENALTQAANELGLSVYWDSSIDIIFTNVSAQNIRISIRAENQAAKDALSLSQYNTNATVDIADGVINFCLSMNENT